MDKSSDDISKKTENKRIVFYGDHNTSITIANAIKETYYHDTPSDLIIRYNPGLSMEMVNMAKEAGIYQNVFVMNTATFGNKWGKFGRLPHLRALLFGKTLYKYHSFFLKAMVGNTKYDRVIVHYFTNGACYILRALKKTNQNIQIEFMEDGLFNYCRPKKVLTSAFISGKSPSWKEKVSVRANEWYYINKVRSSVNKTLYVCQPEMLDSDMYSDYTLKKIPCFTDLPVCKKFFETYADGIPGSHLAKYQKRDFIFVGTYKSLTSSANAMLEQTILLWMLAVAGGAASVIKSHSGSEVFRKGFAKQLEGSTFIDREKYAFEYLLDGLDDLENKVIIAQISTVLINMKIWLDREPYVIYTYRLFPDYVLDGVYYMDMMADALRKKYSDPSKVMTPNTLVEYVAMLELCKKKIHAAKHQLDSKETQSTGKDYIFSDAINKYADHYEHYKEIFEGVQNNKEAEKAQ